TPLTAEQRTYAKAAKTSGETLLSLIEEVLDFSKIEAGRLDLEARPFALAAMVEEVVELLAPRAQAKGIEISMPLAWSSNCSRPAPRPRASRFRPSSTSACRQNSSATSHACAKCCSIS